MGTSQAPEGIPEEIPEEIPEGLLPRQQAARVVRRVLEKHLSLKDALEHEKSLKEHAFVYALAGVVLRRLGEIDAVLQHLLSKRLREPQALTILRVGLGQILFLRVPPYAATHLAVAQAKGTPFEGLINAVLRRAAQTQRAPCAPEINMPRWLWRRWCKTYGPHTAQALAAAHLHTPPIDLTCQSPSRPPLEGVPLSNGTVRLFGSGPLTALPGYKDGHWWVQDVASALIVPLLGDVHGREVLDMCAAPGGKTAQLAARGAQVTALDIKPKRIRRLKETLERLRLPARILQRDATCWAHRCERILLDAPCSATGTIRHNPDILHTPRRLKDYLPIQRRLLHHAAHLLAPGGVLIYACCSLEPEEGEQHIERLLRTTPTLQRCPITPQELSGLGDVDDLLTPAGDLRTLPCHLAQQGGMDGLYAARLAKRKTTC